MTLTCTGSESSGNGYILESKDEILLLEAGIRLQILKQFLNHDLSKVQGVVLTHGHLDHAKYINDYMAAGIECFTSQETINHLGLKSHRLNIISDQVQFAVGDFKIIPFAVPHNLPCLGFLISNIEMGKLVFITDAAYCPVKFKDVSHYCIEINYSDYLLTSDRAVGCHQSIDTALQFLRSTDLRQVRNIILLHLSSSNSDSREFVRQVQEVAVRALITVADRGVSIDISRHPF